MLQTTSGALPRLSCSTLNPIGYRMCTPGSRVARKYRRARLQRLRKMECKRLRAAVPSIADETEISEVRV